MADQTGALGIIEAKDVETPMRDGTVLRSYAGVSRNVNYIDRSVTMPEMNLTDVRYWDKPTGILCEMVSETSTVTDGYVTTSSTVLKMIETNGWFHDVAVTSVTASPVITTVGTSVVITVVVSP